MQLLLVYHNRLSVIVEETLDMDETKKTSTSFFHKPTPIPGKKKSLQMFLTTSA